MRASVHTTPCSLSLYGRGGRASGARGLPAGPSTKTPPLSPHTCYPLCCPRLDPVSQEVLDVRSPVRRPGGVPPPSSLWATPLPQRGGAERMMGWADPRRRRTVGAPWLSRRTGRVWGVCAWGPGHAPVAFASRASSSFTSQGGEPTRRVHPESHGRTERAHTWMGARFVVGSLRPVSLSVERTVAYTDLTPKLGEHSCGMRVRNHSLWKEDSLGWLICSFSPGSADQATGLATTAPTPTTKAVRRGSAGGLLGRQGETQRRDRGWNTSCVECESGKTGLWTTLLVVMLLLPGVGGPGHWPGDHRSHPNDEGRASGGGGLPEAWAGRGRETRKRQQRFVLGASLSVSVCPA